MHENAFLDKARKPTERAFLEVLSGTAPLWQALTARLREQLGALTPEWKYYGAKLGWTMKLLYKKRNLFFCTAARGQFRVSFVFGEKAVAAVMASKLPKTMKQELQSSRKYAEGRGLRVIVKTQSSLRQVETLVDIKLNH